MHAKLNEEVCQVGDAVKRIYIQTYQVLPFIYTHLVSFSCAVYLVINAFIKALYFQPDATITFGLVMPLLNVFTSTLTIFGLLEVGDTLTTLTTMTMIILTTR